jgi:hypothetical protein
MSTFEKLWYCAPLIACTAARMDSAQAATQGVAPVRLPRGGYGVDGPFFPTTKPAPVTRSTGTQLQRDAQQRIEARPGANAAFSNGASITKAQAESNGQKEGQ